MLKAKVMIDTMVNLYDQLVDSRYRMKGLLPQFERGKQGIYFVVRVSSDCYGYEEDGNTHHPEWRGHATAYFHVIILDGHKVFYNIKREYVTMPQDGWVNSGNHNSCYRHSLDELVTLGFEVCDEAWKNYPEEHLPVHDKDRRTDFTWNLGIGKMFQMVEVEHIADPELNRSHDTYFRKITSVKPLDLNQEENTQCTA